MAAPTTASPSSLAARLTAMSTGDIGESLIGAYLRHVENCSIVTYNSFFADRQGEVDVVAVKRAEDGGERIVYICEVTTHTGGMAMVRRGRAATQDVVLDKLERLQAFAGLVFPGEQHRYRWWSPYVPVGRMTDFFAQLEQTWEAEGRDLRFVINHDYTACITQLIQSARTNSATTNEPAYRLLQILTRLRGEKPTL